MAKKNVESTKKYLPFSEIRDNLAIMKDGSLRSILLVSSINFGLKGMEEQEAIIQGYIQFLNSLSFPLQIVVQSRKLNIEGYLESLHKLERAQTNSKLKLQTADYRMFIQDLVELSDIMEKRFYAVVSYQPSGETKRKKYVSRLQEAFIPVKTVKIRKDKYEKYREELFRRVSFVKNGLSSIGLNVYELETSDIITLLYNTYNPRTSSSEKISELNQLRLEN